MKKMSVLLTIALCTSPCFSTIHAYDTRPLAVASIITLGGGAIASMYAQDEQQRKVAGTFMILGIVGLFASAALADQPPVPEACACVCHTQPQCKQWTNWLFHRWAQGYCHGRAHHYDGDFSLIM